MNGVSGKSVLVVVGYGLFLALSALSFWSPLALVPTAAERLEPQFYLLVHVGFALAFALVLVACKLRGSARLAQPLFAATLALLIAGMLLSDGSVRDALGFPPLFLLLGALVTGLGFGTGLMCWMLVFSTFSLRGAWVILTLGSVLSAVPAVGVSYFALGNAAARSSFVFALLLLSLVLLTVAMQELALGHASDPGEGKDDAPASPSLPKLVRNFGIVLPCVVVLSLFQPFLDSSGLLRGLSPLTKTLLSQGGNAVGALIVLAMGRMTNWTIDVARVFLWITPVFATVCLLFPFISESYWFIFSFVSMLIFSVLSIAVMLSCLRFSAERGVPLPTAYGILGFCLYAPDVVGNLAGLAVLHVPAASKVVLSGALLLIAGVCGLLALRLGKGRAVVPRASQVEVIPAGEASPNETPAGGGALTVPETCAWLSARYELTAREGEVLEMLAHGRNVPFIADALHLSAHTVRGYVKTVYQHLDVHSRQELIDLVEATAQGDEACGRA